MWNQHAHTKPLGYFARYLAGPLAGPLAGYSAALALAAALLGADLTTPVLAQQNRPAAQQSADAPRNTPAPGGETAARPTRAPNENALRLPADSTTEHVVELPGRALHFKATAGSIPLNDAENGNLQAEVAFVAYVLGDAHRPVTFLFNGGPGAASAYLDIGAVGPWRLPFDNISASATPALIPNAPGKVAGTGLNANIAIPKARATEGTKITFALLDSMDEPVTDLQPYLGAMGHLVVISADGKRYVHAHPVEGKSANGVVEFAAYFSQAGIYKGWGQFQRAGQICIVPFVVKVD